MKTPKTPLQSTFPFSRITASPTLWQSIGANALIALRDVNRELYHSLTPTEQRLGVYLAKMLNSATIHRRSVDKIASQMPIFASRPQEVKRALVRACDGLIKKKFPYLTSYSFEKGKMKGSENIIFRRHQRKQSGKRSISRAI